jgi:putative holliday junction resolvase
MTSFQLPESHSLFKKRILALDYGEKVIGLASFWIGVDPFPLLAGRLITEKSLDVCKDLQKIIDDEDIHLVVVGIPLLTDGKATSTTEKVQKFAQKLKLNLSVPVHEQDETLSTFEAKDRMKNSPRFDFKVDMQQIDSMAASIILEDFIHRCQQGFLI